MYDLITVHPSSSESHLGLEDFLIDDLDRGWLLAGDCFEGFEYEDQYKLRVVKTDDLTTNKLSNICRIL